MSSTSLQSELQSGPQQPSPPPKGSKNPYLPTERNDAEVLSKQRAVLKRLKAWHRWEQDKQRSLLDFLFRTRPAFIPRPPLPSDEELSSLAEYYFPLRDDLEVTVCDFKAEGDLKFKMEPHVTTLKYLDSYLAQKPSSVHFRWIHVPVGAGWLSQKIDLDFDRGDIKFGLNGGTVQFKVLSLRDTNIVQDQLDVFNILQEVPRSLIQSRLRSTWASYTNFRGIEPGRINFWRAAASDMPGPIAQTSMVGSNRFQRGPTSKDFLSTKQFLSRHPDYENLMLTTDNMSCVSSNNGVLLTMLSSKGLNHLTQARSHVPWPNVVMSPHDFVLGSVAISDWPPLRFYGDPVDVFGSNLSHNKHIEMFLLRIITGLCDSPSTSGLEMSGLEEVYQQIVLGLKDRGSKRLRRQESLTLVQDIISCRNEISQVLQIVDTQKKFLQNLRAHFPTITPLFTLEILPDRESKADKAVARNRDEKIDACIEDQNGRYGRLPMLSEELKSFLDIFFQLKTIEQNEMALLAESNNQAILVFTVVTVVFLPLSFFTSYFGMNVRGIADTTKDERYFWMVCGPVTVSIVLLILVFGFRKRFKDVLWSDQTFSRSGGSGGGSRENRN